MLLGIFGIAGAVFMLWGTFAWWFVSGLALGRACGGSLAMGAGVGILLGVVVGLAWTAVVSVLLAATCDRSLAGRAWAIGPAVCLAVVAVWVISEARTPLPAHPLPASACSIYE